LLVLFYDRTCLTGWFSWFHCVIRRQLSFLASIITKDKRGPHIVIAPLAVVQHWSDEARDWFPGLTLFVHSGSGSERLERLDAALKRDDFDIIVTSYELALRDLFTKAGNSSSWSVAGSYRGTLRRFRAVAFEYVVLDEAHRLKNPYAKLTIALRKYGNARRRILLTGTPLSNNLVELWALLNVLNPRIFGSVDVFKGWFASPFDDGKVDALSNSEKALVVARMHTVLRPFFLRRMREDVCPELAPADELIVHCPSTPLQTALQHYLRATRKTSGVTKLRNVAMEMRKASNCAWLVSGALFGVHDSLQIDALAASSGKLMWLHYALPRLLAAKHRVLIFSQFVIVLDYISDLLDLLSIRHGRLDGRTTVEDRAADIAEFNTPASTTGVFLLSTRAGGCGINMQSADTGRF
jgi:SNF2 family DNA or RNA helicase